MITKITEHLFIGEYSDIVWQDKDFIEDLKKLGITTVINCMERNDPKEEKVFHMMHGIISQF